MNFLPCQQPHVSPLRKPERDVCLKSRSASPCSMSVLPLACMTSVHHTKQKEPQTQEDLISVGQTHTLLEGGSHLCASIVGSSSIKKGLTNKKQNIWAVITMWMPQDVRTMQRQQTSSRQQALQQRWIHSLGCWHSWRGAWGSGAAGDSEPPADDYEEETASWSLLMLWKKVDLHKLRQ